MTSIDPVPSRLGRFEILDRIGQGGMGEVFRARDTVLGRNVAIKTLQANASSHGQRFLREARSAARLTHPNIVVVHDFGESDGRLYMAMELLEGTDLQQLIEERRALTLDQKLAVMEQVCDAMAFAHAASVIHRDLKPANVFVLPNGSVKVVDFGLARISGSSLTGTGLIVGTPNYMAPEQIRGERVDERADIFAIGAVFFELLSSRKAFAADSLHTVLFKILQRDPDRIELLVPGIPPRLASAVMRCLAKNREERWASAAELRDELTRLRQEMSRTGVDSLVSLDDQPTERIPILKPKSAPAQTPRPVTPTAIRTSMAARTPTPPLAVDHVAVTFVMEDGGADRTISSSDLDKTILQLSLAAGIAHVNECGGRAQCSTCRVRVESGISNLMPRNAVEQRMATQRGWDDSIRLACQTRVRGDVRLRRLILDRDDASLIGYEATPGGMGRELPIAVLHASVRNFAPFVKKNLAYDVVHVLNRFFAQIGEPVIANGGHIDHYSGASMVALFGTEGNDAREKCLSAARAALRMRSRVLELNHYIRDHFDAEFQLEVGLHFGRCIVGQIGHPKHARMTAVGDALAVAAGAASTCSGMGTAIAATEEFINVIGDVVSTAHRSDLTVRETAREYIVFGLEDFQKPDTVYLVQSSFELMASRKDEAAVRFYQRLFQADPDLRPLFAEVDMSVQGAMLMNMIAAAVRGLDNLEQLRPVLHELGLRHRNYGAQIHHYAAVEAALLATMEEMIGPEHFTMDVKLAWTRIYNFIAQVMIEASLDEDGM
jgi:serine/threonine protein kinase/hemoglobin-like flavoprotein/class 3 adenylate cyclase